ncbi:MAG: HAMP domain-containing sensor histidine kinase [Patescibacteria group bacterium]
MRKNTTSKGEIGYLNRNCWLVRNLGHAPYKRCRYCDYKFRNCLFLHYQIISLVLIFVFVTLLVVIEGRISTLSLILIFTLVVAYGYFFNKSTEKIIKSNFSEKQVKKELEKLTKELEKRVNNQTKDIRKKNTHLKKLLAMRSEFLDVTSHQLRTPVSVLIGVLEMASSGDLDKIPKKDKEEQLNGAYLKAKKLEQIISDLLRASELDTDPFTLKKVDFKPINLQSFLSRLVSQKKLEAKQMGVELSLTEPLAIDEIYGDERFLEEAVGNLLDNAVKYTPETNKKTGQKGKVSLSCAKDGKNALIKVSDNGIGIPKDEIKKLFAKFARAKNARDMYTDGTGLGLFIVREIVRGHGGTVKVKSKLGQGSVFTISLPLSPPMLEKNKEKT